MQKFKNIFLIEKSKYSRNIKYDLKSVKFIGLTNEVFDYNTINFIDRFVLEKLEILYINRNEFTSLSFIKKLELNCLKEFNFYKSHIREFKHLKKIPILEVINMKDNYINDISNLDSFVKNMPTLKCFNLIGNDIDVNDENNQKIINSVKTQIELLI